MNEPIFLRMHICATLFDHHKYPIIHHLISGVFPLKCAEIFQIFANNHYYHEILSVVLNCLWYRLNFFMFPKHVALELGPELMHQ